MVGVTDEALLTVLFALLCCIVWPAVLRCRRGHNIRLQGPPSSSWLAGNTPLLVRTANVGDTDFDWVNNYGLVFNMKGNFNEDVIYVADPLAMHYILNVSGYSFHKRGSVFVFRLIAGQSVVAVEDAQHVRQRKILAPGFSYATLKELVPLFTRIAQKAASKLRDVTMEGGKSSAVIDMSAWVSRITLDALGEAAFNYEFGALENVDNELTKVYHNVFTEMYLKPTDLELAVRAVFRALPLWMVDVLRDLPLRGMRRIRAYTTAAMNVAKGIVRREMLALEKGLPLGRDVMSILVRANTSQNPNNRLTDEELLSQMTAFMVAGHDTTLSTLSWMLYELSRHPDVQEKLRVEIQETRSASAKPTELSMSEFEGMTYTQAVLKETLRFYPVVSHSVRKAGRNDVLPLSKSIVTAAGEEITSVPVREGQTVLMSICAYNRIKHLWGEDADEWKPERFLSNSTQGRQRPSLGLYANLATFSSGVHGCIGYRFALLEMQAVLIELIENFEFALPPGNPQILRAQAPTLKPVVKGEEAVGSQLPLRITPIN